MTRATARAMVTPRTRGGRAMTTMGASGRERIVGARRRANRARAVGEDGKGPGTFLRPDGSPPLESYNGPTVWRLMQEELIESGLEQITPTQRRGRWGRRADGRSWTCGRRAIMRRGTVGERSTRSIIERLMRAIRKIGGRR